ncbi:putative tyrosinase [Cercophora samala]|uniref:tyrosinase n=1 Tax=Cercophora samala TaxID=330535 RepID=A0AA39Z3B2_9PEZI|nr:putative tyrosinase [Cercophora samala]
MTEARPDHVVIQGILPNQAPGIRREFTDWAKDPENNIQVSLFIRALQKFYDIPYTDTLSFFQVASIHGYPGNLKWDNSVAPPYERPGDETHYFYCTHNHFNFPTWHRPYMILFEQTVWELMGKVINEDLEFHDDADKQAWLEERNKWRLPYWDWALNSTKGKVPDLFVPSSVNIRVPLAADGSQPAPENVPNPLSRYQVKVDGVPKKMGDLPGDYKVDSVKLSDGTVLPWAECSGTSRWGIVPGTPSDKWSEGVNQADKIAPAINNHEWYFSDDDGKPDNDIFKHPVGDLVHRLFSGVKEWENFSSTRVSKAPSDKDWRQWVSLEYVHNNLHGWIGGDGVEAIGHMQNVPSAAFDPIFYMHHCNIDRITAIWQTLNDKAWFKSSVLAKRELYPFRGPREDGKIDYFTSNDVRDWTRFGYQYDLLEHRDGEDEHQYRKRILAFIDRSYLSTGQILLKDESHLFHDGSDTESFAEQDFDDYLIDVVYDRYVQALFLVLTGPTNSPKADQFSKLRSQWRPLPDPLLSRCASPHFRERWCGNCVSQQEENVLSNALIPLTIPLYNAAADKNTDGIESIRPDEVKDYLAGQLTWIAVTMNGTIIPWDRLPKTKVFVLKGKAKHYAENSKLSSYREYDALGHITHDKPAGASHEDYGEYA